MNLMEQVVSLAKRRAIIYPGSEIYGGLASTWDYGPYGVLLKNNVKQAWWKEMVLKRSDIVGLDASILMNPKVWKASGHEEEFIDPLVECEKCHLRFKVDDLIQDPAKLSSVRQRFMNKAEEWVKSAKADQDRAKIFITEAEDILSRLKGSKLSTEERERLDTILETILSVAREKVEDSDKKIGFGKFLAQEVGSSEELIGLVAMVYLNESISCPRCKKKIWNIPRAFNLMLETHLGPVADEAGLVYLRPETAQGIFVNFKNILDTTRVKLPFGVAQIGKAFRNEITPGNFIFRTREFEQMELEYFIFPKDEKKYFDYWVKEREKWYLNLGIDKKKLHLREHSKKELAHYAKRTIDIEYDFPFGRSELEGIASRGDFDLRVHEQLSGKDLKYFVEDPSKLQRRGDDKINRKFWPYIIEPSGGVDRAVLAFLIDSYCEEFVQPSSAKASEGFRGEKRVVLKLDPGLAPIKIAVLPLVKKEPLIKVAKKIFDELKESVTAEYDEVDSIGRRYRRQDEIGTPFAVTVDFESIDDKKVTVRDRDSMKQERVKITGLTECLQKKLQ